MPDTIEVPANSQAQDDLFTAAMNAASSVAPPVESTPAAPEVKPEVAAPAFIDKPEVVPSVTAVPEVTQRFAPQLLKLMEREAKVVAQEAELKKFREQAVVLEQASRLLRTNAPEFVRKFAPDLDPGDAAKQLWYAKLGSNAPPEHRAEMEARAARSGIDELRAEFTANQQRLVEDLKREQADAAYHQYVGALGSYAKAVPDEYPLVQRFAKENPERVQQGLFKIAQNHAQATGGLVLTPAEAAARLNQELDGLRKVLGENAPIPVTLPAPTAQPTTSLRNKHQSIQPNRTLPTASDEESKFLLAVEAAKSVRKQN